MHPSRPLTRAARAVHTGVIALLVPAAVVAIVACSAPPAPDPAVTGSLPGATSTTGTGASATLGGTIDCRPDATGTDGAVTCDPNPDTADRAYGTVEGRVVAGPTCPVVREGDTCADRLVPATITISGERGTYTVTTATGRFTIDLPMGTWTFQASSPQAMACPPIDEPVQGATPEQLTITCDTGIR